MKLENLGILQILPGLAALRCGLVVSLTASHQTEAEIVRQG